MPLRPLCGAAMSVDLSHFVAQELAITCSPNATTLLRSGWRTIISDAQGQFTLARHMAGRIPYFYRSPFKIAADFAAEHDAIEMVRDMFARLPKVEKFQNSHFGEILCAIYMEDVLKCKRLYSKLTLLTAENTNAHKMDAFFVDTETIPFTYYAVEAKSSIQPTTNKFRGHRYSILRQMIKSIGTYSVSDRRFDFISIRDNLESERFSQEERKQIRADLIPPGPASICFVGVASINNQTLSSEDDDYILCEPCSNNFIYRALVVTDLKNQARQAYDVKNLL